MLFLPDFLALISGEELRSAGFLIVGLDGVYSTRESFLIKAELKPTFTYKSEELTFIPSGRILTLFPGLLDLLMPLVLPSTLSERMD